MSRRCVQRGGAETSGAHHRLTESTRIASTGGRVPGGWRHGARSLLRGMYRAGAAYIIMAAAGGMHDCLASSALAADVAIAITDGSGKPISDAVVAFTPVDAPVPAAAPHSQASIDQVNRTFRPHVLALQAGTLLAFPNSDNIRHEVYSFSEAKSFATKLYSGKAASPVLFDKPGVVVLGCNIHDSMRAYLYVVDTPYFATTDAAGHGVISAPPGRYAVKIWHPRYAKGRTPASGEYRITAGGQELRKALDLASGEE